MQASSDEKTREMQKKSSFFFSFPSDRIRNLLLLGLSKNFGKAIVKKKHMFLASYKYQNGFPRITFIILIQ